MGVESTGIYQGQLHCELTHSPSGAKISTDAPKDNMGKGEAFSPTDLVGAALGSCIVTTMAIVAQRDGIPFEGGTYKVTKEMSPAPRRIAQLIVELKLPASVPEHYRSKLEEVATTCPVYRSLNPELQMPVTFSWSL